MYARLGYEVTRHEGINKLDRMPRRFRIANALARGRFSDMQFVEFATVARPIRAAGVSQDAAATSTNQGTELAVR